MRQVTPAVESRAKKNRELPGPKSPAVRIILVDDNELFRAGVKSLISAKEDLSVVGEAKDKTRAVDLIGRHRPDVVLLHLELKHGDSLEMIPDLLAACETSRIAVLTESRDPEVHRKALSYGAIGVISKEDSPESFINAIKRVHSGGVWLDRFVSAKMLGDLSSHYRRKSLTPEEGKIATLTNREREVIQLVGEGLKNKQIGERLFISDVTVHHHLTAVYSKVDVKDKLELIIYAYKNGLAEVPC